jgi:NitT/TauT family transport system ATP-binding protein
MSGATAIRRGDHVSTPIVPAASRDTRRTRLEVRDLRKTYGSGPQAKPVLDGLTFDVRDGEFTCVVGPSGAGKTTLLKCLCGLLPPSGGEAYVNDERVTGPPRGLALVFQEYTRSLMPWLTVERNVALPLAAQGVAKAERRRRAEDALEHVGLADAARRHPWQLSGGMQQRVAIARALAYQPEVLVMDEPFASVDAQTRFDLEDLTLRVREEYGITIVFVTHDIDEAVYLSDRVVVLSKSPCRVQEIIDVDLPGPRDQVHTRAMPRFAELRTHLLEQIKQAH